MDPNLPIKQESSDDELNMTNVSTNMLKFYFKLPECSEGESLQNDIEIKEEFDCDGNENKTAEDHSTALLSANTSLVIKDDNGLCPNKSICTISPSSIKENANDKKKDIEGNQKSYTTFTCEICNSTITSSHDLKEHLKFFHMEFLNYRAKTYCITTEDALQDTYNNHVSEISPWLSEIISQYQKIRKEIICAICKRSLKYTYYFKKHLRLVHTDFLKFIAKRCQITEEEALQYTYHNNTSPYSPWPDSLLDEFRGRNIHGKGENSNNDVTDIPNTYSSRKTEISRFTDNSEVFEQLRNIEINRNTNEHAFSLESVGQNSISKNYSPTLMSANTSSKIKDGLSDINSFNDSFHENIISKDLNSKNRISTYTPSPMIKDDANEGSLIIKDLGKKKRKRKSNKFGNKKREGKLHKKDISLKITELTEGKRRKYAGKIRKSTGNCPIICKICKHKQILGKNMKRHLKDQHKDFVNFRAKKYQISTAESLQRTYKNHILLYSVLPDGILADFLEKNTQEKGDNSNIKEIDNSDTYFSKEAKIPGGMENSEDMEQPRRIEIDETSIKQTIIKNKGKYCKNRKVFKRNYETLDENVIKEFFYKEDVNGKDIWFCATCYRHNTKVGLGRKKQEWHTGVCGKQKLSSLKDCMIKHLRSETHKKYKEKAIEQLTSEELSMTTTQNLCTAAQFFATHNLTQSLYPGQFELLYKINENLGPSYKSQIHPLGNQHYATKDIIEAQKACFLAVQEQMRGEDETIFPPTGLLPRYTLVCGKAMFKGRQRLIIIMMKIDYTSGTLKEYLINASIIPPGTSNVFEQVTKETEKLIFTKRIAFLSYDKESVNAVDKFGIDIRMEKDDSYSDKIINLEDVRPNIDRILFSSAKTFPDHVKDEKWVADTYIKGKEIIGCVLTNPKISKILQEYSDIRSDNNVTYYPFRQKYSSHSLNFLLKNLEIMIKVLPEVASEDMYDILTQNDATKILSQIQDPLFVTRLVLLDKIFYHVLALEKISQNINIGPFEYIRTKNYLLKSLQDTKLIHEGEIKNIVEHGTFEFKYKFRNKLITKKVALKGLIPPGQTLGSTALIEKDCCVLFIKWVDNLIFRLDRYMPVPECMRLAVRIFTITDKELSSEQFYEKVKDLRNFLQIINTDFEECGEDCEGIKDCLCLSNQFKRFLELVIERKNKCTNIDKTDNLELYKFYLCELNFNVVKELQIRNVLRALEISMLMMPSQFGIERVLSEMKKTDCSTPEKFIRDDMVNIIVFLRMNSSIEMIDARLASSKYVEQGY